MTGEEWIGFGILVIGLALASGAFGWHANPIEIVGVALLGTIATSPERRNLGC